MSLGEIALSIGLPLGFVLIMAAAFFGERWYRQRKKRELARWPELQEALGLEMVTGGSVEIHGLGRLPDPLIGVIDGFDVSISMRKGPRERDKDGGWVEGGPETWVHVELHTDLGLGWSDPRESAKYSPGTVAESGPVVRAAHWLVTGGGDDKDKINEIFSAPELRAPAREADDAGFELLAADEMLALRRKGILVDALRLRQALDASVAMAKLLSAVEP